MLGFKFFACIVGCFLTSVLFIRYVAVWKMPLWQKSVLFALFMIPGCTLPLVDYRFESFWGGGFFLYRYTMYFIFILCVILLTLTVLRDVAWGALFAAGKWSGKFRIPSPKDEKTLALLNAGTVVVAFLCTAFSFYEGVKIPDVKEIELSSPKIKNEYKIAVLSDLHIHRVLYPWKIWCTALATNKEKPDIILLAGDVIDDDTSKVRRMIRSLGALKAGKGIFFVTGNHEFYAGYRETVDALKRKGFTFLENSGRPVGEDLFIAGLPDVPSAKRAGMRVDTNAAFKDAGVERFRLLMSHTPADFGKDNNFDLEVSGHTHGGQIFPFHLIVKKVNKYLSGLYDMENGAKIYVSNGAGQWGPQMRFLAPSEITIIKLVPEKGGETERSERLK